MILRHRRRDLFLNRSKGKVDWCLLICLICLLIVGVVSISNATADPYAQAEGEGLLAQLSRVLSYSTRLQLIWIGGGCCWCCSCSTTGYTASSRF